MSNLSATDIQVISDMIQSRTKNGRGFIWDFSNNDFKNFVYSSTGKDIYDDMYVINDGKSKMKRFKTFLTIEEDNLVIMLLKEMKKYGKTKRKLSVQNQKNFEVYINKLTKLQKIIGISNETFKNIRTVELITKDINDKIAKNEMNIAIDRVHELFKGYIQFLCKKNRIKIENKSLDAIYGEYMKFLHDNNKFETKITQTILTSSKKIMKDFDYVRNNKSAAHFNSIINNQEAVFICYHILNIFDFLIKYNN